MTFRYRFKDIFPENLLRSVQSINQREISIDGRVYKAGTLMFQAIHGTWDGKEVYLTTVEIAYCGMSWQLWGYKVIGKWYRYIDHGLEMYNEIDFAVLFAYMDTRNNSIGHEEEPDSDGQEEDCGDTRLGRLGLMDE